MKKRFVVALENSTNTQAHALADFADANGLNWWHWIGNFWLLIDERGDWNADKLRDAIGRICPKIRNLVLELGSGEDSWAGFGPSTGKSDMFEWLQNYWGDAAQARDRASTEQEREVELSR